MITFEDFVFAGFEAVVRFVESMNTITVFGVGFWTWLLASILALIVLKIVVTNWLGRGWLE